MKIWQKMNQKEDATVYSSKDSHLVRSLGLKEFLALGIGSIVSASIFTLPGIVAAQHAGPAVTISFLLAAIISGMVAMSYAEMSAVMPFAGSAYSWINILYGKFWGWIAGWALLAEYFIVVSFVAAGLSANFQGLISPLGIELPKILANPAGVNGGWFDITVVIAISLVGWLLSQGTTQMARVEKALVVLKVLAILLFIVVGATAIHLNNYVPFVPAHHINADGSQFGGWQGVYAGVSMIFLAYVGFDTIAANSAEAKNPQKTMPRAIIGSLIIAAVLFILVSLVLVGMFKYTNFNNNAEPVGWALRKSNHYLVATVVQGIAVVGMFTALIGMSLAGSRLLYSFGRDAMLPKWLGHLNQKHLPNRALLVVTLVSIFVGAFLPFSFLSQLISAGTLIAFMFVSVGMFALRRREGKDLPKPAFKSPFYPWLPTLGLIGSFVVFMGLDIQAKLTALVWFIIGLVIYFSYGIRHESDK